MSKPRIFVSSTFYDLKQVRADLERFIRELGYEPVMHERGSIPYSAEVTIESSVYQEIEYCDIVVSIVGGRYGTESRSGNCSISQMELKRAVELGKQVFIFVDRAVWGEFSTYKLNRTKPDIEYSSVDNVKIFEFLSEVESLPRNNATTAFELSRDIVDYLRDQWAGLFQRFLREASLGKSLEITNEMQATARTMRELVTLLLAERDRGHAVINNILLNNHPAFSAIATAAGIKYRLFFSTLPELEVWMEANRFRPQPSATGNNGKTYFAWKRTSHLKNAVRTEHIWVIENLFEDGKLKIYTPEEWNKSWVINKTEDVPTTPTDDDEIPF